MAMTQCGECGKDVSDKAAACPNCGAPVSKPVAASAVAAPPPPAPVPPKKSVSGGGLAKAFGFVVLALVASVFWRHSGATSAGNSYRAPVPAAAVNLVLPPQVVFDEEIAVDAHGWRSKGFALPHAQPVRLQVTGGEDTAKGFDIMLLENDDVKKLQAEQPFQKIVLFSADRVRSFTKTADLPAGTYNVVIRNSYNLLKTMSVHVKATANPN